MEGVISSRNYSPGDVIYTEPAFAKVLTRQFKDSMCEFCCKTSYNLKACKACLAVKYCGKECQKKDWSTHKLECEHMKNLPNVAIVDCVRLLGKIILKLKGQNWKTIKSNVLGKEISFDDIDPHYKEMTEDPRLVLFFHEMKDLIGNYIGFENLPDDESFIKIVGKVNFYGFKARVAGLFIGAAMFKLECIPTSSLHVSGNVIRIWASKRIRKGDNKITIPLRLFITPPVKLPYDLPFSCKCEDCSLPFGESTLFKIVDKKTAYSVIRETEAFLDVFDRNPDVLWLIQRVEIADRLLRKVEGVLGETNYLYLGLLTVRCLDIRCDPMQRREMLLKLERIMKSVFGEYYIEMLAIYKALCATNMALGHPLEAIAYAQKAKCMEQQMYYE